MKRVITAQVVMLWAVSGVSLRSKNLLAVRGRQHQPARCTFVHCAPFGGTCKKHDDCVTDSCYAGRCAHSKQCKKHGEVCRTFASGACCTGECEPVLIKTDCVRLLREAEGTNSETLAGVVNVDHQCRTVGVCGAWAGAGGGGPSPQFSTPWAVSAEDMAAKYLHMGGVTFASDVVVRSDLFAARQVGQKYEGIDAGSTPPGAVRDAGTIVFTQDSYVDTAMSMSVKIGSYTYCAAPILRGGAGGGYYAVGRECCEAAVGFTCGSAAEGAVKSGLVVAGELEKYAQAVLAIEATHGSKIHGPGKGLLTALPIYVYISSDPQGESSALSNMYQFVSQQTVTYCVAPLWRKNASIVDEVNFWAAGRNCCSSSSGFHCGDVDKVNAHSGRALPDTMGEFRKAVTMAQARHGIPEAPPQPMFVTWTQETLVMPPSM